LVWYLDAHRLQFHRPLRLQCQYPDISNPPDISPLYT
jgi:hypothetical protein